MTEISEKLGLALLVNDHNLYPNRNPNPNHNLNSPIQSFHEVISDLR